MRRQPRIAQVNTDESSTFRVHRRTFVAILILVLCTAALHASDRGPNPVSMKLNVSWRGRAITVADKRLAHTYYFEDEVEAYQIRTAKLQSAKEADGGIYLLFDVTGYSLGPAPVAHGECGSGEEKNLSWVKLDANWKVVDKQSVLYASCTENIELHDEEGPTWSGDVLSVTVDDLNKKETRKIEYSLKDMDKGLQVTAEGTLK
jgi:hypothetical protein